ncbi:MAG: metallophosphoesterase [Verrucomicrobia bacterium]|nr:metallophosphoesterase [Verrucomicrobiota bacterium]
MRNLLRIVLRCCLALSLAGATTFSTHAAELPALSESAKPFSFVVLGDVHYTRPKFEVSKVIAGIARSVKDCQPPVAFVCQTGDIAEGGTYGMKDGKRVYRQANHDEMKEELAFAMKDVTERFRLPLFIAVGNHDKHAGGKAFPEVALPLLSRELGVTVTQNCYGFRYGNSCFVFLDFAAKDFDAQRKCAEELLANARAAGVRHIFLFAHYPLWTLIRPGFSSQKFTDSLMPIFKQFPVDAFFCGHTHNTAAWVRHFDGATITQIQGVTCQSSPELVPMEERRTLMMPREELSYYWGHLSGPPAGLYLVTVDGERVRVQFRSGAKMLREFEWREPGRITDTKKQEPRPSVVVTEATLKKATAATLALCWWGEDGADIGVSLNGEHVAKARLDPTMRNSNAFASEKRIPIPTEKLRLLRLANDVTLGNPSRAIFGVGHAYLEIKLSDGRTARTTVSNRFLFSATQAEGESAGKTEGWKIIPSEALVSVNLGQPLGPMRLIFAGNEK